LALYKESIDEHGQPLRELHEREVYVSPEIEKVKDQLVTINNELTEYESVVNPKAAEIT